MSEAVTLNSYRQRIATHMAGGNTLAPAAFMAFGDGGHNPDNTPKPPQMTATALYHEVLRKPLSFITQEDEFSVTGRGVIDSSELEGVPVSEAALVDSNGDLIGIDTFAPKYKEIDETYEISIKLRF
jgi:phage-related tail fiber protein